jgi:hypothetical protein
MSAEENRGAPAAPRLVVSPLNGAVMPAGAHRKNTGGKKGRSGRLPSDIRKALRKSFDRRRRSVLEAIADGRIEGTTPADRLRAMELMAKYGLSEPSGMPVADVRDKVAATLDVIRTLPPDLAQRVVDRLRPIWRATP